MHDGGAAGQEAPSSPSRAGLAALALWIVLLEVWFQGPVLGGRLSSRAAIVPALALAFLGLRAVTGLLPALRRERPLVLAVAAALVLTIVVRIPALLWPAGLLSSDSAVAGIIAQEIQAGQPAPIYAPGFPYEGTLKPHLTVALDALWPDGIVTAYTVASLLLYLVWVLAAGLLAHRVAGPWAALAAGAFMAVGPRFLMAFSLNNVGQYPDVNALGALGLALLSLGGGLLASAFLIGLAVWQQLLGVYFVLVLLLAVVVSPPLRRPRSLAWGAIGFVAGSYPLWIWNAANAFATFDLFRRGGKNPADRVAGLPDRIERTVSVSLPKLFGLTDLGLEGALAGLVGLVLPMLVVFMLVARREDIARQRGRSAALLCGLLMVVVIGIFAVSKFSNRGAQRPRYLMPVYTSVSVALGWGLVALGRRSRPLAAVAGVAVLLANVVGVAPWLRGRRETDARDRALVQALENLGVRTGYTGFWIAAKYTFLSEGRVILSGELGPDVSWVHAPHAQAVRAQGPDGYVVPQGPLVDAMVNRMEALGCTYRITRVSGMAVFSQLSRRVTLEEMDGYDATTPPGGRAEMEEPDVAG
jgi:hypothetical protein